MKYSARDVICPRSHSGIRSGKLQVPMESNALISLLTSRWLLVTRSKSPFTKVASKESSKRISPSMLQKTRSEGRIVLLISKLTRQEIQNIQYWLPWRKRLGTARCHRSHRGQNT